MFGCFTDKATPLKRLRCQHGSYFPRKVVSKFDRDQTIINVVPGVFVRLVLTLAMLEQLPASM